MDFVGQLFANRLHIRVRIKGLTFLIETGAEVSIIPVKNKSKIFPSNFKLYETNGNQIDTYGSDFCSLRIGLRPS